MTLRFLIRDRQQGKTFDSFRRFMEDPKAGYIVFNEGERDRLAKIYGLHAPYAGDALQRIMTASEVRQHGLIGRNLSQIIIDNVDLVLPILIAAGPTPITLVTAREENDG